VNRVSPSGVQLDAPGKPGHARQAGVHGLLRRVDRVSPPGAQLRAWQTRPGASSWRAQFPGGATPRTPLLCRVDRVSPPGAQLRAWQTRPGASSWRAQFPGGRPPVPPGPGETPGPPPRATATACRPGASSETASWRAWLSGGRPPVPHYCAAWIASRRPGASSGAGKPGQRRQAGVHGFPGGRPPVPSGPGETPGPPPRAERTGRGTPRFRASVFRARSELASEQLGAVPASRAGSRRFPGGRPAQPGVRTVPRAGGGSGGLVFTPRKKLPPGTGS
jgi:hypothetical protein